jgi:hypothetical protein
MSGGYFDYGCFKISQFADDLLIDIDANDKPDHFGVRFDYSKQTINNLRRVHKIIELSGELAKATEWLYSGDHSEETFNKLFTEIMEKQNIICRCKD